MTIEPGSVADFGDYEGSLNLLEEAFKATGMKIEFVCQTTPLGEKYVHILENGRTNAKQYIEGDGLVQAIKDVAKAVRL